MSEDEIKSRFLEPYLNMEEGVVVMKKGHTLVLRDDNRKTLEFTVIHLGFGEEDEKEEETVPNKIEVAASQENGKDDKKEAEEDVKEEQTAKDEE